MAGVGGFEPPECQSQSLMPYRLATPQSIVVLDNREIKSLKWRSFFYKFFNLTYIYILTYFFIKIKFYI